MPDAYFLLQQFIVSEISDIGEEAIIMFEEEGGVGAEEVVGTEEFVTCFVDSSQVRYSDFQRPDESSKILCRLERAQGTSPSL